MMKDDILVSVCIPVYNGEKFLKETIDSVLIQDIDDMEIIVVDDCSTDNSIAIIKSYNDERIKVYKNYKNMGIVKNWNKAIEFCNGKYIKILCQDDLLLAGCLKKQIEVLKRNEHIDFVTGCSFIINAESKVIFKRINYKMFKGRNNKELLKTSLKKGNFFGEPSLILFRKRIISQIGMFDDQFKYFPDWEFWLRGLNENNFYCIDDFIATFRISKNSVTSNIISSEIKKYLQEDALFLEKVSKGIDKKSSRIILIKHKINMIKVFFLKRWFLKIFS